MKPITKRLLPGQDLKAEIEKMAASVDAGVLLSVVGSLNKLVLRLADGKTVKEWQEEFEIVSGTGTVSKNGCHIHLSAADKEGKVIGGHLKGGCIVNTTVEVVIVVFDDAIYTRQLDEKTGYPELSYE